VSAGPKRLFLPYKLTKSRYLVRFEEDANGQPLRISAKPVIRRGKTQVVALSIEVSRHELQKMFDPEDLSWL
jgi:hypothetical protein